METNICQNETIIEPLMISAEKPTNINENSINEIKNECEKKPLIDIITRKKKCSKCGVEKEFSEYNKHKIEKDGHKSKCRKCQKEESKIYYQLHKTERKLYRDKNKESKKIYQKNYKKENKNILLEKRKENTRENAIKHGILIKKCSKCKLDKSLYEFQQAKTNKYGVH